MNSLFIQHVRKRFFMTPTHLERSKKVKMKFGLTTPASAKSITLQMRQWPVVET